MIDYYAILGIQSSASTDDIKKAFRKLAHIHHPDKGGSEGKFKEINEAYQVLQDPEKKRNYDAMRGFRRSSFDDLGKTFHRKTYYDFSRGFNGSATTNAWNAYFWESNQREKNDLFNELFKEAEISDAKTRLQRAAAELKNASDAWEKIKQKYNL